MTDKYDQLRDKIDARTYAEENAGIYLKKSFATPIKDRFLNPN